MKKIISIVLLLTLCLSLFAGCNNEKEPEVTYDLASAKAYLTNMYQTAGKGEVMTLVADKDVLSKVTIDGVVYDVEWTVKVTSGAAEDVKVGESTKANQVKLDINEKPATELLFTATATIKAADGSTETVSFDYKVAASAVAGLSQEQIVEEAYKLENGEMMEGNVTLTGEITMVKTPYDASYQNITVIIQIGELTDKRIECYRLKGEGADTLAIGDTITVTGVLKNYNGTIEFDAGCNLDSVVKGETVTAPTDPKEIVDAAYALAAGDSLPYSATLTGVITEIKTPWDEGYQNISVIYAIEGCEDKPILAYRLKGDGAATLAVGDTITVTGYIVNYNGTIEFTSGCVLDAVVKGEGSGSTGDNTGDNTDDNTGDNFVKPTTTKAIVDAAYALDKGETLQGGTYTLSGKITKVNTAYSEDFQNITVTIAVSGYESKEIKCYRLKGSGAENLAVGDTITVTGNLENYNGEVQLTKGNLDKVVAGQKAPTDQKAIVDAAYALDAGKALEYEATLTGKIVELNVPYDSQYKNMNITIAVSGREDKPILCYRLKGDAISNDLCVGDTITVTGVLKNYNGTIEFDSGCVGSNVVSGGVKKPADAKSIVDAAFALAEGESLAYFATLTGTVKSIETPYGDGGYNNVTLTITVEGKDIVCFRMKGDFAAEVAEGDTISVTGILMNYKGTIEFGSGCICEEA